MAKREILFRGWNKKNKRWLYADEDCLKEGIMHFIPADDEECTEEGYGYLTSDGGLFMFDTPRETYASLINKICGKGTWERNPWVEAYTFTRVD